MFCDINMPELDGLQTTSLIVNAQMQDLINSELVIIGVTAFTS